ELRRAGDVSGGCVAAVLSRDRKAYWVDPRDAELARDLDAWLAEREADGLLPAVRARYGLEPAAGGADALLSPAPARVADLVGRRLLLMPLVAEAKRARGAQVEDLGREAVVERRAADAAGLAPEPYRELARAQIAASKAVQRAVLASATGTGGPALDLDRDLRPAIDRADDALRAELVRGAPSRRRRRARAGRRDPRAPRSRARRRPSGVRREQVDREIATVGVRERKRRHRRLRRAQERHQRVDAVLGGEPGERTHDVGGLARRLAGARRSTGSCARDVATGAVVLLPERAPAIDRRIPFGGGDAGERIGRGRRRRGRARGRRRRARPVRDPVDRSREVVRHVERAVRADR